MKALRRRLQKNKLGSRGVLRDIVLIAALVFLHFSWTWFLAGLAVFILGCALHFWSKGCLVRNWMVTRSGPYRLVRHPFYLANFIIDAGICIMSGNAYLLAVYVPLFLIAYLPVIEAEERDLVEAHDEYRAFARQVPRLLPYKLHRLFGPLELSWTNIQREQEIPRLLRIMASPLYVILAHLAWSVRPALWFQTPAFLAVLGGIVLLNLLGVLLRWDPFSDLAEVNGGRWSDRLFKHPPEGSALLRASAFLRQIQPYVGGLLILFCLGETLYWRERPFELDEPNRWVLLALVLIMLGLGLRLISIGTCCHNGGTSSSGRQGLWGVSLHLGAILIVYGFCVLLRDWAEYAVATAYFLVFHSAAWFSARLQPTATPGAACNHAGLAPSPALVPAGLPLQGFSLRRAMQSGGAAMIALVVIGLMCVEAMAELL